MALPGDDDDPTLAALRVLVGDADPQLAAELSTVLRGRGYETVVETTGEGLLQRLDREGFDVVILAWSLPDATGLDVLRKLRARFAMPDLPVMMMSKQDESKNVVQAFDRGANDFLRVPLDRDVTLVRVHNLVALRRARVALRQQAMVDPLTNIFNRRYVMQELESHAAVATRYGRPLSFCLGDIDHFKSVNDSHGHRVGDEALRRFAGALRARLRRSDIVGRFGGDELCVVFPETAAADAAIALEEVRATLAGTEIVVGESRPGAWLTVSFGVADLGDGGDVPTVISRADEALYRSKAQGRNRTTVWRPKTAIAAIA